MPSSTKNTIKDPTVAADERAFLGEEFLTWLWFRAERGDAEFDLGGGRSVGVVIDAPLLLRSTREDAEGRRPEQVLRFGQPLTGAEAAAALRRGKKLCRARLILGDGGREWILTFDAETFTLRSIRIPEPDATDESGDRVLEQVAAFDEAVTMMDEVYKHFLDARLAPDFRTGLLSDMRSWVRRKQVS